MKLKKREAAALRIRESFPHLTCPVCQEKLAVNETSLICANRHQFDIAKNGSLHLLKKSVKTNYTKELFQARRYLMDEVGFFYPVTDQIVQLVQNEQGLKILDAGCGEGTHLSYILRKCEGNDFTGIGMDLAKDGIQTAASHDESALWITADLAKAPVENDSIDIVLNILSPANYREFSRLLTKRGRVIKVVPRTGYLKELRQHYFDEEYTNEETTAAFYDQFDVVDKITVQHTQQLDHAAIAALVRMTPLSWRADQDKVQSFLDKKMAEMTIDVDILIGVKKVELEVSE
ncbi:putative RNA methyltransferase [Jeotgalibacillus sp. R-1-5s-1]|uniref:putative RNA methyltransferase n=1 Tax=Jeotgalibacillus sp. R-1-5s-1 TaxID=2555897 RepID=UPI00141B857A|nr:methyltransferase domain-containing protein [Jeotgalibacillus sp. R-1-5s-1]